MALPPEEGLAAAMNRHVGQRVRERRLHLGLSLEQLAMALGVTAQQARKYEAGRNALPAGRLAALAAVLRVPIGWFFAGLQGAEAYAPILPTRPRMLLDIVRNFERIDSPDRRLALLQAARALAIAGPDGGSSSDGKGGAEGG
jgi:transcriptional regulator with XRE-family HTH domain